MGKLKNEKAVKSKKIRSSTPKSDNVSSENDSLNTSNGSVSNPSGAGVEGEENSVYLCGSCNEAVVGELTVSCEICHAWFHYACVNIPADQAEFVNSPQIHWFCQHCNTSAQELIAKLQNLILNQQELKSDLTNSVNTVKTDLTKLVSDTKVEVITEAKNQVENSVSEMEKRLEEKLYAKVVATVKEDNSKKIEEVKQTYASAATPLEEQLTTIKTQLKNEVKAYTETLPSKEEIYKMADEQAIERDRIKARAANLILHNLPESQSAEDDVNKTKEIIKEILKIPDFQIIKANRLGFYDENKSRLFKITLNDVATKKKILARATMLRDVDENDPYASVYIRPDMTPKQVEASKNLQSQLREIRAINQGSGKKFKIFRGKIVEIPEQQQEESIAPIQNHN